MKHFLTPEDRETLKETHRLEADGRRRDWIKAILLRDGGMTYGEIGKILLLDEETISHQVKQYLENGKLGIDTGGSQTKLNDEQTLELIGYLEENTFSKAADIAGYVLQKYNVKYTVSGMTAWLKSHKFSHKKPKETPAKADAQKQERFIEHYNDLMRISGEDEPILFMDGVHPTMSTKTSSGWIRRGVDKAIPTTGARYRLNLVGAINLETMDVVIQDFATLNSDAMEEFFAKIRSVYPKAPKIHLILDQGRYNTSKQTKESAENHKIILHYLPPYSPNLNAIERLWKVMNEYVRNNQYFAKFKEFKEKILAFFHVTWPKISWSMTGILNDNFQKIHVIKQI